jgi:hypothetical protein
MTYVIAHGAQYVTSVRLLQWLARRDATEKCES